MKKCQGILAEWATAAWASILYGFWHTFSLDKIQIPLPFCLGSWELQFSRQRPWLSNETCIYLYFGMGGFTTHLTFYFNTYFNVAMTETREENNSSTSLFSRFILSLWSSQTCPSERLKRYILKKTHFIRPKSWQETHLNEKRSNQLRCSDACIWNHMVVLLMAKLHLLYFNTKMPRTLQRVQNSVVGYKTTQKLKACFS